MNSNPRLSPDVVRPDLGLATSRKTLAAPQRNAALPWIGTPDELELEDGEVHLWRADLNRNMPALPTLEQALTPDERRRARAFCRELDRNRYILARAALRDILARYLKTAPDGLRFYLGRQGKPELAGRRVCFNLAHSGDLALYAITRVRDVGVDVERVRPGVEEDVAGWFFSLRALRFLEALPQPARRQAFFQVWTRMEAYSKARGQGITAGLRNVEVFLEPRGSIFRVMPEDPVEEGQWWLHDFSPAPGYVAAVAVRGARGRLRYWEWQAHGARNTRHLTGPIFQSREVNHDDFRTGDHCLRDTIS